MKKCRLLFILLFFCCKIGSSQNIEYSKGAVRIPVKGHVRLMADVNGFHHLIHFSAGKKPVVYIFNSQLNLDRTIELDIKLPEKFDVGLVQLKDDYILYAHAPRSARHQLVRITGNGTTSDISSLVNNPADSLWNRSTSTFQLFSNEDSLFLISHFYLDQVKKIRTTIVQLNPEQGASAANQVFFPFDSGYDELAEVALHKNNLLILKTSKDQEDNNTLTLLKFDLVTGKLLSRQFESAKYRYYIPSLRYNANDSSIFIYSVLAAPLGFQRTKTGLFMVRLDNSLNEASPVSIVTDILRDNVASSFIVEMTKTSGWICFSIKQKDIDYSSPFYIETNGFSDRINLTPGYNYSAGAYEGQDKHTAILMTVLNNRLEKAKDSLIKNKGNYYKVHPSPYAYFVIHNTPYLLLVQEPVKKRKALLLVSPSQKDEFETVSLRVYDRFNFALSLLQTAKDKYFIVPFTDKKEMGLMKVTLND